MVAIKNLESLLKNMSPVTQKGEYVFCSVKGDISSYAHLKPLAFFHEDEGLTLVLSLETAESAGLSYEGKFKQITLMVYSSLDAVGLTAAVATKLAEKGISANVIAAFFHDHIFVPSHRAEEALEALAELSAAR